MKKTNLLNMYTTLSQETTKKKLRTLNRYNGKQALMSKETLEFNAKY